MGHHSFFVHSRQLLSTLSSLRLQLKIVVFLVVIFLNHTCFAPHKKEFSVRGAPSPDTLNVIAPWVTPHHRPTTVHVPFTEEICSWLPEK